MAASYLPNVVKENDLIAAWVKILSRGNLAEFGDEKFVAITRGLNLKHLLRVVFSERGWSRLVQN